MLLSFTEVGRVCEASDNVAIAVRRIEAGSEIVIDGRTYPVRHTVLEGHRFAVRSIAVGEPLRSWTLPFGHALMPIAPGDYVCNASMLEALAVRRLGVTLPEHPNFADHLVPFVFDEAAFRPAPPVDLVPSNERRTFLGYRRPGRRGVGTRNMIVVLGTTSRTASLARELAARLQPLARLYPQLDGIVAVAHTEGGDDHEPNNITEILRALAGFIVHPNVGAVLALDYGVEPVTNARMRAFMEAHQYPLNEVPHAFLSVTEGVSTALAAGEELIRQWLPKVAAAQRTPEPLSELRVALQCGGSDAFSGVSGNPLAGRLVHEVVRQGGSGVLCETDELGGAEAYVARGIRDVETARALFRQIDRTRERLGWHGVTFESNPSAGNKLRGLYNITLKSLGAVHKKDPRTRIEHVIDYAEPLTAPGFYFMDSPGNDLEAIAGEVAAGCNLILFITGNGSVTNFPFVPTLKITTTTRRHELLIHEMDINAGRYLDGEPMETVAADAFELLIATASGRRSRGEKAGHSQTSLWREWRQTDRSRLPELHSRPVPDGRPLVRARGSDDALGEEETVRFFRAADGYAIERVGLVLPTSLCSSQIARMAAERMNARGWPQVCGLDRFVALPHSEGCGFGGESMYQRLHWTYRGYATHPNVAATLLLEHGCEKISNDAMRRQFETAGVPLERFGWASVQLDGGIEKALAKIEDWFGQTKDRLGERTEVEAPFERLGLGMLSGGVVGAVGARALSRLIRRQLSRGGSVLLPEGDALLESEEFRAAFPEVASIHATLAHGQAAEEPGLHVVATETRHWVENVSALGASGVHLVVGLVGDCSRQGHPLIPVLQVAEAGRLPSALGADVDLVLGEDHLDAETALRRLLIDTVEARHSPVATANGLVDFQITRGLLGVST